MRSNRPVIAISILLVVAGLFSCARFRPDPTPSVMESLPETFSEFNRAAAPETRWWETFEDPRLNELVERAFAENLDLEALWARLRQARASVVIAGADLYPDLAGAAGLAYSRVRTENGSSSTTSARDYSAGLFSSYELDLWGRIRAERETAVGAAIAGEMDYAAAAVTLAAEVTDRWLRIVSQTMQIRLLNDQLAVNRTFLELIELRFRQAMVSALDVYQQQQVIDSISAEIPLVQASKSRLLNELAVLLGKAPSSATELERQILPDLPALPPTGIPADLLANRPDVKAAQWRLEAAGWNVAAARADRLPSIALTARGVFNSEHLDLLLDNWILSLASDLTAPIFDGGRRAAAVDRARALRDENLADYRLAVLNAIREVEDALVTEAKQKEHIQGLEKVVETARKALRQAALRYRNGLTDYLPVLTQILTVQNQERNLIVQKENLLANRVRLYRALGGTWPGGLVSDGHRTESGS